MTTYCSNCDLVHPATRDKEPWKWRCLKVPVAPGYGFVSPDYSPDPPYQSCHRVNTNGQCDYFVPARKPAEKAA